MGSDQQVSINGTKHRNDLRTAYKAVGIFGLSFSFCVAATQLNSDFWYVLGAGGGIFGLLVVMLASLIMGLKHRKESFLSWIGPISVAAGFIFIFPVDQWAGQKIADWRWETHLQKYTAIIADIRSGKVAAAPTLSEIDTNILPPGVIAIDAARASDGSVMVVFLMGGDSRLHSGYVFNGSGTNMDCILQFNAFSNKFNLRKEAAGWYHFSD